MRVDLSNWPIVCMGDHTVMFGEGNISFTDDGPECPGCTNPGKCTNCEYDMEVEYTVGVASRHNPQGQLPGLHITVTAEIGGVQGEVSGWHSSWKDKEGFMASEQYGVMCRCALHFLREKLVAMWLVVNPDDEADLRCIVRWFDRRGGGDTQKNYKVSVVTEIRESREEVPFGGLRSPDYPVSETVEVRAHSELDARVMAFILVGHVPDDFTPTWLIAMAYQYTEIIP